jgi:hypothetical protein
MKIKFFTTFIKYNHHHCCTILQGMLISSTLKSLRTELQREFPRLDIELV